MATPQLDGPTGWFFALLAAVFGGGGFWGWWTERGKSQRMAPAAAMTADADMVEAMGHAAKDNVAAASEMYAHFRRELKIFSGRCDRLELKNGQLEAKIDECDARHEDCERTLAAVRAEIEQLMRANPPADY